MRIAIFLACLLEAFVADEVWLRLAILLRPRRRVAIISAYQHVSARRVLALARAWCGFRLEVSAFRGSLPRQCLVISNHQSLADIPVLMHALPSLDLRFVAKRELRRRIPAVSLTLRAGEHALIGRRDGFAHARRALDRLAALAASGVSPVVFPEGTRSRSGEVQRFHAAAVRVIGEVASLPILSVAVEGGTRISRLEGIARNIIGTTYRVAPLTLYPPPADRAGLVAVLDAARAEIVARIDRWRAAGAARPAPR